MKAKYLLLLVTSLIVFPAIFSASVNANWLSNSKDPVNNRPEIVSAGNETNKKDSLPEGVTQDWLNSLKDEKGDKIILSAFGAGYTWGASYVVWAID